MCYPRPSAHAILLPLAVPLMALLIAGTCYGQDDPAFTITSHVSGSTTTVGAGILIQTVTATNIGGSGSFIASAGPAGFSIQPSGGNVGAGAVMTLTIMFNAAGLPPGTYSGSYSVSAADGSGGAGGTASETVNGVLLASPTSLTIKLTGSQAQNQTVTVLEAAGFSIPVNASYSGQSGPMVTVNSTSNTPDMVNVEVAMGTLAAGGSANGALTLTCTSSAPCSDTPLDIPVVINAAAPTSTTKSLPHFAVGQGFVSDFYVANSGTSTANFSIAFYDSNGNPIALPFASGSVSTLSGSIDAGGAGYYEAAGTQGTLLSGSALITSDPGITIQALFRRLGSDGSYYEAAVPEATGSNEIQVPFDDTTFSGNGSQIYTGLAIANLDSSNAADLSCTAKDSDGNPIPNAISAPTLNPLGHWANYLFQPLVGQRGTIDCKSNTQIGAIGIRALGANALSSLPIITFPLSTTGGASVLPHFAVGESFASDFYVTNSGSNTANFSIAFHDSNGNPIALPFTSGSVSTLSGSIAAGGSGFYEAAGTQGTLLSGSGLITSDPGITIQALFRRLGSNGSYYEAAVPVATGSSEIQVPFDDTTFSGNGSQIYTGLAVANLDGSNSANLSCTAKDSDGNPIPNAISAPMLNPLGHWANYLFQPLVGQRGTIDCKSNTQIGAIGIRALGTNTLSSLPVIVIAP